MTRTPIKRLVLIGLLALAVAGAAQADDRRLIAGFEEIPTVFFLFDTSGSMHWSSRCTQEDFDAGDCDLLCPTGSCWVPGNADSPSSKFYQAKEAIYTVIDRNPRINVGFATFNQDQLRLRRKHWLYEALDDGPDIPGWGPYPRGRTVDEPGEWHIFGDSWSCFTGPDGANNDDDIGCDEDTPADLTVQWDRERVAAWAKETPDFQGGADTQSRYYVRDPGGTVWQILFKILASDPHTLGNATIRTRLNRSRCTDTLCTTTDMEEEAIIDYGLITDFDAWDVNTFRGPFQPGFFSQGAVSDGLATGTCVSWDANTDTPADVFDNYNVRFPTVPDATFPGLLDVGDVLPLDWRNQNRKELLYRLAPNLRTPGQTIPDFRIATYFEDTIVPAAELHLKDEAARPIVPFGATPIGTSMGAFYDWIEGADGWLETATANDPSATCRKTHLIVITDGNQSTCDADDPCLDESTKELFEELGIQTFVVAFGVPPHTPILPRCTGGVGEEPNENCCAGDGEPLCVPSDSGSIPTDAWPPLPAPEPARQNRSLRCMASTGGTGSEDYDLDGMIDSDSGPGVIYPQNQQELVDALSSILDQIRPAPTSFSSAAVPSVQAEAADKVFLSDLIPVPERSNWIGRINAFLKPVPVDVDNQPDTSEVCPADDLEDPTDDPSACLLWEVNDVMLNNQINVDPIGDLANQRRVYYSEFSGGIPRTRHFFEETIDGATPPAQEFDLWRGFDLDFDSGDPGTFGDARDDANEIIDHVLSVKTTPDNDDFPVPIDYILNDLFHSDPLLLGSPNNLLYFFENLHDYRDFALDHAFRRRMLLFGSNGGMLHGIDAGVCRELTRDDPRPCLFDNGSGRELFGYVPRSAMPSLKRAALDPVPRHRFMVDGRTQAADVRIDPLHDGALSDVNPPTEEDREWRTVLVGGLREGGNLVPEGVGDLSSPADANPNDNVLPIDQPTSGYYALDVTMPDPLEVLPPDANRPPLPQAVGIEPPSCLKSLDGITPVEAGCGPIAFAAPLWEFTDSIDGLRLDEDNNGHVDLAFAWSNPNLGRIQVCTEGCSSDNPTLEDRHVAIFGGGFDPDSPFARGKFVYMLDIETGEALYKHEVFGAAPGEPAAVDTDFDGYIDTVYIGTTLGLLYRINLAPLDTDNNPATPPKYPEIEIVTVTETPHTTGLAPPGDDDVSRDMERIVDPDFGPKVLLEASDPDAMPPVARPIFFRPSVAFLPEFNKYAIAVGTGNREDIFQREEPSGRFFVFVDNVSHSDILSAGFTPFSPLSAGLTPVTPTSNRLEDLDLLKPGEGWWMELADDERLVTEPFALSGILFFSTFIPDPDGPVTIPDERLCRERGVSNIYGVFTTNADGLLAEDDDISDPDQLVRFLTVTGLVSPPYAEQSQTKNPPPDSGVTSIDDLSMRARYVRDRLKEQFPENCTFPPGYRIDIKARNSGTDINFIAPVPICVVEKNFREF